MHSFKQYVKQFPIVNFLYRVYLRVYFLYLSTWSFLVSACVDLLQRLVVRGDIDSLTITKNAITLSYYKGTFNWNPRDRNSLLGIGHSGRYERGELDMLTKFTRPGMTVVDVGANYGLHSIYCAQLVGPRGHVYSFEPLRTIFRELKKNIEINNVAGQVTVEQMGLSYKSGKVKLFVSPALGTGATSLRQRWAGTNYTQTATLTTLDQYVKTHKISHIDVIKCDVEGAELLVFSGAKEVLRRWHPVLLFESIENHTTLFHYEVSDLLNFIVSYGYMLYRIEDGALKRAEGAVQNGNYLALPQRKRKNI